VLKRTALLLAVALATATSACASAERAEAEHALALWRNTRPLQYTYVLQPIGWSSHEPVRIRVDNEEVIDAVERSGASPAHHHVSMTELLKEAVETSDEDGFSASYDPELGYIKTFFYGAGRAGPGSYGFEVPCLEPSLDELACDPAFAVFTSNEATQP
jgi:hypothetical protein